jgi:hypothetical protein
MARPKVAGRGDGIYLTSSHELPKRGSPTAWVSGERLTTPHRKIAACYEMLNMAPYLAGSCEHCNEPSGSILSREFLD